MKPVNARILHAALRLIAEKGSMQISISDLAKEAGLSRGTIYNNVENPDELFNTLCDLMYLELCQTLATSYADEPDPALRLAFIIRQTIRRVYEEPDWGRFVAQFAMIDPRLGRFWGKLPADLLRQGLASGRFDFREDQVKSITALGGGAVMGATSQILIGLATWRKSGADTAELFLRAVGIPPDEAHTLSTQHFEPLPRVDFSTVDYPERTPEHILG
ncbi:transcriptional regulator, TetR family [Thalassovita litoralis]|jgi:AcrR family transcriptional regulator|uniref:Transcriptional regulator, TetR family n=1 Tax=Thalassovita litoralis TaxID=1010611 RepID=A0A521EX17_9RHOB|nr:TetR/AcrR family transcriptional regulator [Thalassovita litoralis]SMO88512.1 transcriptional regulator, TetR family [Thalassovita litoralis]